MCFLPQGRSWVQYNRFLKKKIGSVIFWRREMLDKKGRCHYTKNKEKALPAKWSAPYRHLVKKD
jgi:hypothetical protein